jgi:hypothetical protein
VYLKIANDVYIELMRMMRLMELDHADAFVSSEGLGLSLHNS